MVDALVSGSTGQGIIGSVKQVKRVASSDDRPKHSPQKEEDEPQSDDEREARRKGGQIDDHA